MYAKTELNRSCFHCYFHDQKRWIIKIYFTDFFFIIFRKTLKGIYKCKRGLKPVVQTVEQLQHVYGVKGRWLNVYYLRKKFC